MSVVAAKPGNILSNFLAVKKARILELMQSWTENTIELGKELKTVRDSFEKGDRGLRAGWNEWLKDEIGIAEGHARSLIRVADQFDGVNAELATSFSVLEYLSREHVPDEGRREVIKRIESGEQIGKGRAKEIVDEHRPKPKEANQIAHDTGKPTLASDGYLYFGASKDEAKQIDDRRTAVYAVRRAVETLAEMEVSPHQFIQLALPHQLWTADNEGEIDKALKWLSALHAAWEHR